MTSYIKSFGLGLKLAFAERMAYRADFFICMGIMFFLELFFPIVSMLIYRAGVSFPGWSLHETLLIQGIFILAKGIGFPLFTGMFFNILWSARTGRLDLLLLRPQPVLFTATITAFNVHDASKLLSGLLITSIALTGLPAPSALQWVKFFFLFLLSIAVIFTFFVLMAVFAVRFVGADRIVDFIEPVSQFGLYPRNIFSKPVKIIASNILPLAMIGYFPAATLLGKDSQGILGTLLTAAVFIVLSLVLWSGTIRKYTSAGG